MVRPRTTSLSEEEMIALGEEMVAWVDSNNPLHLSEWYSIEKMIIYKDWKAMIQLTEFLPYYERALKMIARNYLDGTVAPPIAQRFMRIYFGDVRDSEDQHFEDEYARKLKLIQDEAKLKADIGNQTHEETREQLDALLALISSTQSSRKIDANKSNTDIKS